VKLLGVPLVKKFPAMRWHYANVWLVFAAVVVRGTSRRLSNSCANVYFTARRVGALLNVLMKNSYLRTIEERSAVARKHFGRL
jgi:phosphoketolase